MKRTRYQDDRNEVGRYPPNNAKCARLHGSLHDSDFAQRTSLTSERKPPHLRSTDTIAHNCKRKGCCPDSLTEIAAKIAAANIPFELVEERFPRVPEPVLSKLIRWSFPRSEGDIWRYSGIICYGKELPKSSLSDSGMLRSDDSFHSRSTASSGNAETCQPTEENETFNQGVELASTGFVHRAMQIGFHLSAVVHENKLFKDSKHSTQSSCDVMSRSYNVAVTFDRCKVTSSRCNCQYGDGIFFCRHVVAVLIYRMRFPSKVKIRAPISDTLQQLNRNQLQKLTQYLLTKHPHALPTAQEIIDSFGVPGSRINAVHGAPDPTAGAGYHDDNRWSLDESHVIKHVHHLLRNPNESASMSQLCNILKKVREMMKVRDNNAVRLLTIITNELLQNGSSFHTQHSKKDLSGLWDEIGMIWLCVVLNPDQTEEKEAILHQLTIWSEDSRCPSEDDVSDTSTVTSLSTGRTVLNRAIKAASLDWDNGHLRNILRNRYNSYFTGQYGDNKPGNGVGGPLHFNCTGQPLWQENIAVACARVDSLRSHGYPLEAVRLALAITRTVKERIGMCYSPPERRLHDQRDLPTFESEFACRLIGFPLNPVQILLDTLTNKYNPSQEEKLLAEEDCTPDSLKREAFELSLFAIGEQRCVSSNMRAQENILACEKTLIENLKKVPLDDSLLRSLSEITNLLLEGGCRSGLTENVGGNSLPAHSFANYLFNSLLLYDRGLAYRVGLRAMRMPVLKTPHDVASGSGSRQEGRGYDVSPPDDSNSLGEYPRILEAGRPYQPGCPAAGTVMELLETKQYELAHVLIENLRGDTMILQSIMESIEQNMRNSSNVFLLSHNAFDLATSQSSPTTPDCMMLDLAFKLSMQALRMTLSGGGWRRTEMLGWLVTCATDIGLNSLFSIVAEWRSLFTPVEACTVMARYVISPNTAMRLNLTPRQRDELYQSVCRMAVQCAKKDPQSCAYGALTLSKNFTPAFDDVYHVIMDASNERRMDSSQLYTTARYLDRRGFHLRAYAVAFIATKRLQVPFTHEDLPAASDLLWTTQLARHLGLQELDDLLRVIVSKVGCPTVLSDVLRTCTSSISGRMPNCAGNYVNRGLPADRPSLRPLLEASISAFINAIHSKLSHISPRHYTEFIDFLNKARETFMMAPDGHMQFASLLTNLKTLYKGKKKLLNLVTLRFG